MIHGNERATFCSFCGQPTVIFDRESKEVWPDYIIPFSITEQQAVDAIKEKFGTGRYVPREIKHPKIDKIRGIYIPYWLYTVYMRKKANLHLVTSNEAEKKEPENIFNAGMNRNQSFYTMLQSSKKMGLYPGSFQNQKYDAETRSVSVGINEKTDMFADAYGNFEQVTFDASRKLDDRLSSRLEPYHMEALKPFDPSYLSGFYADRYDVPSREAAPDIHQRISDAMDKAMIEDTGTTYIEKSIEQYSVDKIEYALLPAWFMTFWYRHELYTILVNGQTGKVAADIPVDSRKFLLGSFLLAIPVFLLLNLFFTIRPASTLILSAALALFASIIYFVELSEIHSQETYENDRGYQSKQGNVKKEAKVKVNLKPHKSMKSKFENIIPYLFLGVFAIQVLMGIFSSGGFSFSKIVMLIVIGGGVLTSLFGFSQFSETTTRGKIPGFLGALISIVTAGMITFLHPVSDLYYYGGAIVSFAGIIFTLLSILKEYNMLTMRKLPQFNRQGGDDRA